MTQSVTSSQSSNGGGKERRAFQRYPISLQASLQSSTALAHECTVLDYCIGGMAIQTTQIPPIQDQVQLECRVFLDGEEQRLRFTGRVVRQFDDGFGMTFIDPDLAQLQTLHAIASQSQGAPEKSRVNLDSKKYAELPARQILSKINEMTRETAGMVIDSFFKSASDFFFEKAKNTPVINEQNALLTSLSTLEQNKKEISENYRADMKAFLDRFVPSRHEVFEQDKPREMTMDKLSLVENDEFDHWLSVSNVVNAVDGENREVLNEIERRLGDIYEIRVSRENNPYGPGMFASIFENLIEKLSISSTAKRTCYTTFRDIFLKYAPDLYAKINKHLVDCGVMPVLTYGSPKRSSSAQSVSEPVTEQQEELTPEQPLMDAAPVNQASMAPAPAQHVSAPVSGPTGQAASAMPSAASPVMSPPPAAVAQPALASAGAASPSPAPVYQMPIGKASSVTAPADLYSLVGELRDLQSHLTDYAQTSSPVASAQTALAETQPVQNLPKFTSTELLDTLSSKEFLARASAQQGEARHDYNSVIQQLIKDGKLSKDIGQREQKVMDVAGNVFSSLMTDMQVSDSIRPWIQQLEIPVLKMALLDDSLFLNREHIVRQVINKLADLEVLTDSENAEEQQAVKKAFEWLVGLINREFDGTAEVFKRAGQQLDLLFKVQDNTFQHNLKHVVDEVAKAEQSAPAEPPPVVEEGDELGEWIKKVTRLKEGEWVLFDAKTDQPRRLKVGWVAKKTGKFVFVNALGKKEGVYKIRELAELFRDKQCLPLEGATEPAMDRAQYSMLQKLHQQLLFQTTHDQLTGLCNRREFEKNIDKAINDAKFSGNKHALIFINLDEFSVINNSCGYQGGDALLREMARILSVDMEEGSILARLGGDEFGVLLYDYSLDLALDYVDSKLDQLHDYRFIWDEQKLSVSMSAGLVTVSGHEQNVSDLLQDAESSCRVAKESGGHRVQVYHSGHAKLSHRKAQMEWAVKIDKALDENRFGLRCQRIMPLSSGDSYHDHYEILLTVDEELGINSSLEDFIRAAEQYKRMSEVDRWVIQNSFEWISKNRDVLSHVQSFSINLSGHSLNDESLLEFIKQQMRITNVPIGKICFEITETLGIANLSDAADFINKLKTTGCLFSLDDFGSGMSSYGYLKSLPVDFLKIDGVFVKDLPNNPNDFAVVKSICEIGHFMGKKVIAEFVQDEATIKLLKEIGVDYAQGYAIERPHPLDQLIV